MIGRRQLPAYSPLPLKAVIAGAAGLAADVGAARAALAATLARRYGASGVFLTDSGTGALTLAVRGSLAGKPGASVALPAYGCYDLATAADGAGVPVRLYDVDPATLAPEVASLQRALDRGARAVVFVHLYGIPVDPDPVREAAERVGACLIEDAAQGAGGQLRGRPLGSFGDLTVLSFGRGKGNTAGRGGALLAHGASSSAMLDRVRAEASRSQRGLKELIQLKAQWLLGRPSLYAVPSALPFLQLGETVYHAAAPVRVMSGVATCTLAATLPLGELEGAVRRATAARLLARCTSHLTPARPPVGAEPGYLRLPLVATPAARAPAASAEARALGIMPGYARALCDLPGFTARVLNRGDALPGSRRLAEGLVTVPTHSLLTHADLERIETWLARC